MHSQLGSIIFEGLHGFSSLSTSSESNYAEHALIENKPKLQRVGQNLMTVEGVMLLDVSFCEPQDEIDRLESAREIGEILPLIMGDGRFIGEFVIKSLKVLSINDASNGRVLQAEAAITLLEYYDADRGVTAAVSAIAQAFANPDNNPATFVLAPAVSSTPEGAAVSGVITANAEASTASGIMQSIGVTEALYRPKAEQIVQKMLIVGDSIDEVLQIINADPASKMYAATRILAINITTLNAVVNDVITETNALIADIDANNTIDIPGRIVSVANKGTEVQSQSSKLISSAASLTALFVTQ